MTNKSDGLPFAIDKGTVFYQTGGADTIYLLPCKKRTARQYGAPRASAGAVLQAFRHYRSAAARFSRENNGVGGNTVFTAFDETTLAVDWQRAVPGTYIGLQHLPASSREWAGLFLCRPKRDWQSVRAVVEDRHAALVLYLQWYDRLPEFERFGGERCAFASCDRYNVYHGDQCAFDAKTGALLRSFGSTDGHAGTTATPLVANGAIIGACGAYGGNLCEFAP